MPGDTDDRVGLHVEVGAGDGPFALFVHGMLSSKVQWRPNLGPLADLCRPVLVELLGHGRSPSPPEVQRYSPAAYVAEFERIRAGLGVDRWFVVGQSLGAALTMRYALDHPGRVMGHVFTNSASALGDEAWQAEVAASVPAVADRIESGGVAAVAAMPQHPSRGRRLPPEIRAALVDDAALLDPVGIARTLRHTIPASSCRNRAPANVVPSLLVAGGRERTFTRARRYAERCMPQLSVVATEAGHAVNIEAAEQFNAAVADFFRRRAPASRT